MNWTKEKPIDNDYQGGCLNCGFKPRIAEMNRHIAVGFGDAHLSKNGKIIWEEGNKEFYECITFADAEEIASKEPDNDWRVLLLAPLSEVEYQRQGEKEWIIIRTDIGFA